MPPSIRHHSLTTHYDFTPTPDQPQLVFPSGPLTRWLRPEEDEAEEDPVETLKAHARAAVAIEFTTIPLYLYATWSIHGDQGGPGSKARYAILGVVQQEMLHLSLAGNILRALGGSYKLYDSKHMPIYNKDSVLLYDQIEVRLEPALKHLLGTFVKIEAPYEAPVDPKLKDKIAQAARDAMAGAAATLHGRALFAKADEEVVTDTSKYHSIGEFYDMFKQGLAAEYAKDKTILSHNPKMQFGPDDFFGDSMVVVSDNDSAQAAMTTIVDQGEGAVGVDEAHYNIFLDLFEKRDTWNTFPVPTNPQTEDYNPQAGKGGTEYIYRLARAMDAAYCYLLHIIDDIWYDETVAQDRALRHWLIRCMHPLMMDIYPPLSGIIVSYPYGSGTAGPAFNYYSTKLQGAPMSRAELQQAVLAELDAALKTDEGQAGGMKARLEAIRFSMAKITPTPPPK